MVMITLRNKKIGEKILISYIIYFIKMVEIEKIQIYKEEVLIKQKIYY